MHLKVLIPTSVFLDEEVEQVSIEAEDGARTLLPRHVDFTAALTPGILSYTADGAEQFLAVDGGMFVKAGQEVLVSTPAAIATGSLEDLHRTVQDSFERLDEQAERAQMALFKLESDFVRRFLDVEHYAEERAS